MNEHIWADEAELAMEQAHEGLANPWMSDESREDSS